MGDLHSSESAIEPGALPTRTIRLGEHMTLSRGVDFLVAGESSRDDVLQVGTVEVWDVVNGTGVDHAFHLHGFSFRVLDVNGVPPTSPTPIHTVIVPGKGRVRIAWRVEDRPGRWMCGCRVVGSDGPGPVARFEVAAHAVSMSRVEEARSDASRG